MDTWSLQTKKFHDHEGGRWYFMFHHRYFYDRAPEDQPYALHFRNEDRTVFGVLRFEHAKDNPYPDFATAAREVMDNAEFRASLLDEGSKKVWKDR